MTTVVQLFLGKFQEFTWILRMQKICCYRNKKDCIMCNSSKLTYDHISTQIGTLKISAFLQVIKNLKLIPEDND